MVGGEFQKQMARHGGEQLGDEKALECHDQGHLNQLRFTKFRKLKAKGKYL